MTHDSELEATYRFLNNPKVTPEDILLPHIGATVERSQACARLIVAHDTSVFQYSGQSPRKGLGAVPGGAQDGFYGHFALAISGDGNHEPLGLLGMVPWVRSGKKGKRSATQLRDDVSNEARRWEAMALSVSKRLGPSVQAVHVMDREADGFLVLATLAQAGQRFVIRACQDRTLLQEDLDSAPQVRKLWDAAQQAEPMAVREVPLTERRPSSFSPAIKRHPVRRARLAKLHFSACTVQLPKPEVHRHSGHPSVLTLNVVRVFEPEPPEGQEPVEWVLLTQEPIDTAAAILQIVDDYRARWRIEEYFKALKTGCAAEKRQLESYHGLCNAVAMLAPIAWMLLRLRSLAQTDPQRPADEVLPTEQLDVLRATSRKPLPQQLTVAQAMQAIATLGGHIKNNGAPGWLVLGRGYHKLLLLAQGWAAAQSAAGARCDQS